MITDPKEVDFWDELDDDKYPPGYYHLHKYCNKTIFTKCTDRALSLNHNRYIRNNRCNGCGEELLPNLLTAVKFRRWNSDN